MRLPSPRTTILFAAALFATILSALYIQLYLRGGSRIIDATAYLLEARAIARGSFCFPVPEPLASEHGRFLLQSQGPEGPCLAVLFPPGYPAFLALFLKLGHPMAAGPLIAAALVFATYFLAKQSFLYCSPSSPPRPHLETTLPILSALASAACAALRYHTADTMSHGLSALCFTLALAFAFQSKARPRAALACGFFLGWLAATRPVSALACASAIGIFFLSGDKGPKNTIEWKQITRSIAFLCIGLLPGLILLIAHQYHATGGQFGISSQSLYYANADGPPGCFRYGFGANIGCLHEHGAFVRHNLPDGFYAWPALKTTLRRLKMHLADPANAEPLMLFVLGGIHFANRYKKEYKRIFIIFLAIVLQIAAYAPFYFDGNYPGGGARFYADILPLEHILAALFIAEIAHKTSKPRPIMAASIALFILGFAVRGKSAHEQLRDREGGLPMFQTKNLPEAARTQSALVFVGTDHGFNLAFDPTPGPHTPWIARHRGDLFDFLRWQAQGRPPAFRYLYDPSAPPPSPPSVIAYTPQPIPWIEAEHLWPAQAQQNAWAIPSWQGPPCLSNQTFIALFTRPGERGHADLELPGSFLGGHPISPRIVWSGPIDPNAHIALLDEQQTLHTWMPDPSGPACQTLPPFTLPPHPTHLRLRLERGGNGNTFGLDRIDVSGIAQNPERP